MLNNREYISPVISDTTEGGLSPLQPSITNVGILKSSLLITIFSFLNMAVGFLTQVIIAAKFGAQWRMDAYYASTTVPMWISGIILGSLSITFIPVFVEKRAKGSINEAWKTASNFVTLVLIILFFFATVGVLFASFIITLTAPGLGIEAHNLAVRLSWIRFPAIIFTGMALLLSSIYYAQRNFFRPAMAPFLNALIILASVVLLSRKIGITSLVLGTLIGGVVQCIWLVPRLFQRHYQFLLNIRDESTIKILKLMAPLAFLGIFSKSQFLVSRFIASGLSPGSISYLGYANKIYMIITGLIGVGIGTVVLPTFSQYAAKGDRDKIISLFSKAVRGLSILVIPIIGGIFIFGQDVIRLLFQRGAFSPEATYATWLCVTFYSGALYFGTMGNIIAPAFYARQDTMPVMKVGIFGIILYIAMAWFFSRRLEAPGIAGAWSAMSFIVNCTMLVLLKRRLIKLDGYRIMRSLSKATLATAIMMIGLLGIKHYMILGASPAWEEAIKVAVMVLIGCVLYFSACRLMRMQEISLIVDTIRRWKPINIKH